MELFAVMQCIGMEPAVIMHEAAISAGEKAMPHHRQYSFWQGCSRRAQNRSGVEFHCEHVAVRLDPDVITVTQPSVHVRRQRSLTIQKYSWRRCTREAGADQALELLAGMWQIGLEPDVITHRRHQASRQRSHQASSRPSSLPGGWHPVRSCGRRHGAYKCQNALVPRR